jgi:hypothetical protein
LDRFLAGVEDYIDAVLNGRSIDAREAGVKAMEEPQDRDYWAGLGYAAVLVEYGEQEANQWIAGLYPSARTKEAEVFHELRESLLDYEAVTERLDWMNSELRGVKKEYGNGLEKLVELRSLVDGFYMGRLGVGEASRLREGLEDLLTVFEGVASKADKIIGEANTVEPSAENYKLGDQVDRIIGDATSLRAGARKVAKWIRSVLGDLDAWGGA